MPQRPELWKRSAAIRAYSAGLCRRAEALRRQFADVAGPRKIVAQDQYADLEGALESSRQQLRGALRDLQAEEARIREALAAVRREKAAARSSRTRKGRLLSFKAKRGGR
jgi:hypothetical protein